MPGVLVCLEQHSTASYALSTGKQMKLEATHYMLQTYWRRRLHCSQPFQTYGAAQGLGDIQSEAGTVPSAVKKKVRTSKVQMERKYK